MLLRIPFSPIKSSLIMIILASTFNNFAMLGILSAIISYLQVIDSIALLSSLAITINIIGISFAGIFFNKIMIKYQGLKIAIYIPIIVSLFCLLIIFTSNYYQILLLTFLLSMFGALCLPNYNAILNKIIVNNKNKAYIFSNYQVITHLFAIFSPLVSSYLIILYNHKVAILFFTFFFILSSIIVCYVRKYIPSFTYKKETSNFHGYLIIKQIKPLKNLIISRILNNFIFSAITIALPVLIATISIDNNQFTIIQNVSTSFINIGLFISGIFTSLIVKRYPLVITALARSVSIITFLVVLIPFLFSINIYSIYIMCFIVGITNFWFKISGMTLGQAITPKEDMGAVILASDTIVRFSTSAYSGIINGALFYGFGLNMILSISFIGIFAMLFLYDSIKAYKNQIDNT